MATPDRKKSAAPQTTGPEAAVIKKYQEFLDPRGLLKQPELKGLGPLGALDKLILSEGFYVQQALRTMSEQYDIRLGALSKLPKGKEVLNALEIPQLMQNVTPLYEFHTQMYDALIRLRLSGGAGDILEGLGRCMSLFIPFFKLYTDYTKNYRKAADFLKELTTKNANFVEFLKVNEQCNGGLRLPTLLRLPIFRLPQYLSFFHSVLQRLPDPHSQGARDLGVATVAIQSVTDGIAKSQQDEVARKQVVEVQEIVFPGRVMLVDPSRFVVKKGSLKRVFERERAKKEAKEPKVYLFVLFNDCLLYGSPRKSKLPKAVMRLEGMTVTNIPDTKDNPHRNAFQIQSRIPENHHGTWILCSAKPEGKSSWMATLQQAIDDYEGSMMHRQLGPEMMSCKDYEETIFKKKIKSPKMVRRPAPRKATTQEQKGAIPIMKTPQTPSSRGGQGGGGASNPPPPPEEEPVEYYQAMWDYQAQIPQALSFSAGTVVLVVRKFDNGWWHARLSLESPIGLIPYNYLQPYKGAVKTPDKPTAQQQAQKQAQQLATQKAQQAAQAREKAIIQAQQAQKQQASTTTSGGGGGGTNCEECGDKPPTVSCPECGTSMCAECDTKLHRRGGRANHKRHPLQQTTSSAPSTSPSVDTSTPTQDTTVPGPPTTEPCMACSQNPRAFRCDTCNYEMCVHCDSFVHAQPAYDGHERTPIIIESAPEPQPIQPTYQPAPAPSPKESKAPGPPRTSSFQPSSSTYASPPPTTDYTSTPSQAYHPEQTPPVAPESSAGTGSIFPPEEYCKTVSSWDPWLKKAFFFYEHKISGEKTERRPPDFQTPPASPHHSFAPAPPRMSGGPVPPPMSIGPPPGAPPAHALALAPLAPEPPPFEEPSAPPPMAPPMDESVVAPPLSDDAPVAPDLPDSSSGSSGGGGDDLLSALKRGPQLRKAPPPTFTPKPVDSRDQLMEAIRSGPGLKSLKTATPISPPSTKEQFQDPGTGLAKALEKSLANYRKFVEDDGGGNDEEEEGEFADAEWGD